MQDHLFSHTHKKNVIRHVFFSENYLLHARVIFCGKNEKNPTGMTIRMSDSDLQLFYGVYFFCAAIKRHPHPFVSALEIQFRRRHLLLGDVL